MRLGACVTCTCPRAATPCRLPSLRDVLLNIDLGLYCPEKLG